MKKNYLSIRQKEIFETNPFAAIIEKSGIATNYKKQIVGKAKNVVAIQNETGEVLETSFFKREEYDAENFTKVYISFYKNWFDLTQPAMKLLIYFFTILEAGKDFIYFNLDEIKNKTNIKSNTTILRGVAKLIEAGFLARSTKHYIYFINPMLFFNGNRINFIKQIRLKKGKENKNDILQEELFSHRILNEIQISSNS